MPEIKAIIDALAQFRDERDWAKFHNPKDLAIALSIEASELLELFLWKDTEQADKERIKDELADILSYAFLLADKYDFDVQNIVLDKIKSNEVKYPVSKSFGRADKYTEL